MTQEEFNTLEIGDLVRGDFSGLGFVLERRTENGFIGVRRQQITNHQEWRLIQKGELVTDRETDNLATLRAENARLQAVVAAAGELLEACIPSCIIYSKCHSYGEAYLHTSDCKYTEKKQAYQAALDAARSETR